MINLNEWSSDSIKAIAKELGIKTAGTKPKLIEKIEEMRLSDDRLLSVAEKYAKLDKGGKSTDSKKSSSKVLITSPDNQSTNAIALIEQRLQTMEQQIKYVMQKLTQIEVQLSSDQTNNLNLNGTSEIKQIILKIVPPGSNIKVDELLQKPQLTTFKFDQIERAVLDLIDEERLDFSEGSSIKKFRSSIARIIRR